MDKFKPVRPGLWRKASLTLAGFAMVTTISTAIIAGLAEQFHERERFLDLARANAKFVESSGLPPGHSLARKLSGVLGVWVGFRMPDGNFTFGAGEAEAWESMADRFWEADESIHHAPGWEFCSLRLGTDARMMFLRPAPTWRSAWGPGLFAALGIFPALALLPALMLAKDIVTPLQSLRGWLPRLRLDDEQGGDPLPPSILNRSDEIGDLARALLAARARLSEEVARRRQSERLATFGRMATSLAHEIKNPAAAILMHVDLLREDRPAPEREISLEAIRTSADRIVALVHQWLFVVRPSPPRRDRHDLREIVASALAGVDDLARHHGVTLIEESRPAAPRWVQADRMRMDHAIRNVLTNACQAMPMGGIVRIQWEPAASSITIRDGGSGFSPEALQRMGEPFFSTKEGGLGLGLNLATEVIRAHGGAVHVQNGATGAEVTLCLP